MLHTASFYQPHNWVGTLFRVSRLHPRGRKVQWQSLPFFYPPADLMKSYRSGNLDFESFGASYLATLEERITADEALSRWIVRASDLGDFTLLCFEREGEPCHRLMLARWLAEKVPHLELDYLR